MAYFKAFGDKGVLCAEALVVMRWGAGSVLLACAAEVKSTALMPHPMIVETRILANCLIFKIKSLY
jgi:hypothetical protein